MRKISYILCFCAFLLSSCRGVKVGSLEVNHQALENWSKNIFIPAYKDYQKQINNFVLSAERFENQVDETSFEDLKHKWETAYKAYQKVQIFHINKADALYFIKMSNTFPTDDTSIKKNISLLEENIDAKINFYPTYLSERIVYQGFPALDYLLFAKDLEYYKSSAPARKYIVLLVKALQNNINKIVAYWDNPKNLTEYINDNDAYSSGSYSRTINAFIMSYEKAIRSDKVAYACGAINVQMGKAQKDFIEAYYNSRLDKQLLLIALQSSQDFFNGVSFTTRAKGESLASILIASGHKDLVDEINNQYKAIYELINKNNTSLKDMAQNDTEQLKSIYDVIQKNVANYKTKMLSALGLQVAYVDTDGD